MQITHYANAIISRALPNYPEKLEIEVIKGNLMNDEHCANIIQEFFDNDFDTAAHYLAKNTEVVIDTEVPFVVYDHSSTASITLRSNEAIDDDHIVTEIEQQARSNMDLYMYVYVDERNYDETKERKRYQMKPFSECEF